MNSLLREGIELSEKKEFSTNSSELIRPILSHVIENSGLDIATLTDENGEVIARGNSNYTGDTIYINGLIEQSVKTGLPIVSTEIIPQRDLINEDKNISIQVMVRRIPTMYQKSTTNKKDETGALAIVAVIPIKNNGLTSSILVLADIMNKNYLLVDQLKEITGLDASVFEKEIRVSTTYSTAKGNRYIGTLLSEPVYNVTLERGEIYLGNVWAINKWSRAVYIPLKNSRGRTIGALSVEGDNPNLRKFQFLFIENEISIIRSIVFVIIILLSAVLSYFVSIIITSIRPI
jgi:hypothetical protein